MPAANDKDQTEKLPGMGGVFNSPNLNLYAYVGNTHILKATDPNGKWAVIDDIIFKPN